MTISKEQRKQRDELHKQLWDMANSLYGNMDASDYKDYMLGLIFYRFLSEKIEETAESYLKYDEIKTYREAWKIEDYRVGLKDDLISDLGYYIEPEYLFSSMADSIIVERKEFEIETLQKGINQLIDSTLGQESQSIFDGIFNDMDLNSNKLGKTVKNRSQLMGKAITSINAIDFGMGDAKIDILGDAYEYLIGKFASEGGTKGGQFYTPRQAGKILAKIVTHGKDKIDNVLDHAGGSGSLLLSVNEEIENNVGNFYYQELNPTTYNLAKMNMLLHGVPYNRINMANGDSITEPEFMDIEMDAIVANPPYSQKYSADESLLDEERFSKWGVLPPKGYADYAFVLTMLHTLKNDGTMAIVLPHGILSRGGREESIRKKLIEENYVEAVIGLPENSFYAAAIPTVIIVFRKNRSANDKILFVDASKDFKKEGNKNYITDDSVEKVYDVYQNRRFVDKYAYEASIEEIIENDYNLNISRYVDIFERREPVNINFVKKEIKEIEKEIEKVNSNLEKIFKELGV